jgi:DNA-directed RNA polymerase specialized sigma24 family protein
MKIINSTNNTYVSDYSSSYTANYTLILSNANSITPRFSLNKILVQDNETTLLREKEILIPLSIIQNNSSLESIVLYLKDVVGLKFSEIARILNRDQRTVWVTYNNSKRKNIKQILSKNTIFIPSNIFSSRKFSILETIVLHLKTNENMTFTQIAESLGKNYRTIWTVYRRAMFKVNYD